MLALENPAYEFKDGKFGPYSSRGSVSGTANKVAFFGTDTSVTSDDLLHWDNTNKRLGVGVTSPNARIHVDSEAIVGQLTVLGATGAVNAGRGNATSGCANAMMFGIGNDTGATGSGVNPITIGYVNSAIGNDSTAIGHSTIASGARSTAIGHYATTYVANTLEVGYWDTNTDRVSSIRFHLDGMVASTLQDRSTAYTAATGANGTEAATTLAENMFSIRRDGATGLYIDFNTSGTINTKSFDGPETLSRRTMLCVFDKITASAIAATGTINFDALTQNVLYYTSNASGNWTINVRGSSGETLNSVLPIGASLTVVFMATNGATPYYQTGFQIDGSAVTPKWIEGTAPTAGNANSVDVYTYSILKTASATYTVFAILNKFS
jgi:hypothetical protein